MIRLKKGVEYWKSGNLQEAERCFRQYLKDHPNDPYALGNLGNVYRDRGKIPEADDLYQQALKVDPGAHWIHSNRLMTLNYDDGISFEALLATHLEWGKTLAEADSYAFRNEFNPEKRIHIGFVSGDFRWHSVAFFLFGLLREIDPEKFEITCFSENRMADEMTELIKSFSSGWVETADLEDERFVTTARRCRMDILVDLSGHTAFNRMTAFARRCAPLQISWLGYPTITGNPSMDYWVTDPIILGDSESRLGSERPLLMEEGIHVYHPPVEESVLPLLDSDKNGEERITLGCFNHRAKMSHATLDLFREILLCEPNTELLLKGRSFNDPGETEIVRNYLCQNRVNPDRIRILGRSDSTLDHLRFYDQMDIALDTFPYNGTTTTCEALWMGVPVVTLMGSSHASRVGASLLAKLGYEQWIAKDRSEYADIACRLIQDSEARNRFRRCAREEMRVCGLTDSRSFARRFENCMSKLWADYCLSR